MSRIQLACVSLIASAFVLAGLLVVQMGSRLSNPAHAELVITRDDFTLMTAQTRRDEEALFVLDNVSGQLLVYRTSLPPRSRLELVGIQSMPQLFGRSGGGRGDASGGQR